MSAHRHPASYNGILFNRVYGGTDPDDPTQLVAAYAESDYRLESVEHGRLSTRDLHELRQFMEGAEANEVFEGIRIITGQGRILGSTYADLEDKEWAMHDAFSPATVRRLSTQDLVGSLPDEPTGVLPFDFERDTTTPGTTLPLRFYARPFVGRPLVLGKRGSGLVRPFTFQLVSFHPTAFGQSLRTVALADLTGNANTVTNNGNAVVYPQVRISFSGSNPDQAQSLTNSTTGQEFRVNLDGYGPSKPASVWLMTGKGEMFNQEREAQYHLRVRGFLTNMFLVPGANTITWGPLESEVDSVTFFFRDAYS